MNVKPGDLAIQIKSNAGNEGQIVKVISFYGSSDRGPCPRYLNCWYVEYQHSTPDEGGIFDKFGYADDSWLRPVSGLPLQEDENIDIKEPA